MKRTTIMIPEDLKMRAIGRAKIMEISLGGFIRESLERALQCPYKDGSIHDEDPFFADNTVFSGQTPSGLALNHDDYLYGENR